MRLKKLVLHGFKSFADRTEFKFDQPVTCVVGPNGCGKSNVVDAIKWVLGEQSAKSLRGGAMLDVIFNGADARKASGVAEVELVFENPRRDGDEGPGTGPRYLTVDSDEVSVMRRLWRDGTSEYLINQQGGRLKDIKELFLDTGVGVDAYSIIEQGRVARLLESNPVERRQIFEEAAGISRFKARKKEAQRKLEKVDANLSRLGDITKELEGRLRGVKAQAGRARSYQELASRLSELRLRHALHEYHVLAARLTALQAAHEDARFRSDDAEANLRHRQGELHEQRQQAERVAALRQRAGHELVETRSRAQQAAQQADYAGRQLAQLAEQGEQFARDREQMAARLVEADAQAAEAATSLAALLGQVAAQRADIDAKHAAHGTAQLRHNELTRAIDEQKSGYLDATRKLGQVEGRLNSIEIERRSSAAQQDKLHARADALDEESAQIAATRTRLDAEVAGLVAQIEDVQAQAKQRASEQSHLGAAIKQVSERLGAAREHRSGLLSRQRMLQDLEAKREGISEAVQRVLKQRESRFPFIRGLVADLLRVDVEHAHVIEAALDGRDQWLVADPAAELIAHRPAFDELAGRVNVLRATPQQVIEHLPREERDALREEAATATGIAMNVVAQSELWEVETDQATSLPDEAGIRFIPRDNEPPAPPATPRLIRVNGRLIDALASSGAIDGSPATRVSGSSDDAFADADDVAYDWNAHAQPVRLAIDLVRFGPADRVIALRLLGRTAVVETLADAVALHADGPDGWRYVTRGGDVMEADGTFRVGPLGASMGILSRRSELDAVSHQIAEVDARIAALGAELSDGNEQAKTLEGAVAALRQEAFRLNTLRVEQAGRLQQADARLGALSRERPTLEQELQQIDAHAAKLDAEATALVAQRDGLAERQALHQQQADALTSEQHALVERLRHAAEELTAARIRVGQFEEKQYAARQAVQRLDAQRVEFAQQLERLAKSLETIGARRAQVGHDLAQAEHAHTSLAAAASELQAGLAGHEAHHAALQATVAGLAEAVDATSRERAAAEQAMHKLDVERSEAGVRMEGLVARTHEEIHVDLAAAYAGSAAESQEPGTADADQTAAPMLIDWDAIAAEIRQLRDRIQRLGNVNLDAIGELEELEKRQADYATQVADLASSKGQLEELIEQINADSSIRFEKTFQAVRENFQQMFRKLFGGGKADIILETELEDRKGALLPGVDPTTGPIMRRVDPLEAGIEVIARPPGKNPVTLSQLSGGEKAMTCIALLMSIFKAKPSPFCILDEVDAPLDEANNLRFTQIVQEFLATSQFIIITHHKKTMQIADLLYGITQQVHGVSTRVPVRFDQVETGGRIKDEAIVAA